MPTTQRINIFTSGKPTPSNVNNASVYGIENGHSVRVPIQMVREGLALESDLQDQGNRIAALENGAGIVKTLRKFSDYLYYLELAGELDYNFAAEYIESLADVPTGECSSVRKGNIYARNFDWLFDDSVSFVSRVERAGKRNASISISSGISHFTREKVESREMDELYKVVPFVCNDGISEHGVFCNVNVVMDLQRPERTLPDVETRASISALILVRYVLDNFSTAQSAAEYIRDYVSIVLPTGEKFEEYSFHWMVGDSEKTYALEIVDGEVVVSDFSSNGKLPILTNFLLHGTTLEQDGTINWSSVDDYGSGLERYDAIATEYTGIGDSDADDAFALLEDCKFTLAYTAGQTRKTEFVGFYDNAQHTGTRLTVNDAINNPSRFNYIIGVTAEMYEESERGNGLWQTIHSCVYDIKNRRLKIAVQEDYSNCYEFDLNTPWSRISDKPDFHAVATSGDYNDLENKPTIPSAQVNSDWNATSGVAQILNKPTLAKVATSGSYNDLTDKPTPPSPTSECVPYSNNLDGISDDLGVAWMNTNKESREFGHIYKREQGGDYDNVIIYADRDFPGKPIHKGDYFFRVNETKDNHGFTMYKYVSDKGAVGWNYVESIDAAIEHYGYFPLNQVEGATIESAIGFPKEGRSELGWKDVYDTSAISADITAEVQRATTAEGALSTRIDGKADESTWSASLKTQIDTDHTILSGLSATWTDILLSQIDSDHTTLGTISGYLTSAKQSAIDDAISKVHEQDTDTQLANGVVKVQSTEVYFSRKLYSIGDVWGGSGTDKLSQKLNASMHRNYSTLAALTADIANIPEGAWCAVASFESAQSDDDNDDIIE